MKEYVKSFIEIITNLLCFLSLLAIYFFCFIAYAIPINRMCRVYVSQLRWVVLLFSMMMVLIFAIDDAIWKHIWGENAVQEVTSQAKPTQRNIAACFKKIFTPYETDDNILTPAEHKAYKKAKLKSALLLLPVSIALTELTLYAVSELGRLTIRLNTYLLFSGTITLALFLLMIFRRDILYRECNWALTPREKIRIRCIVTILCVGSALLFVPRASDRIGTYNMYWEGSPQTPFTFEYQVDDTCALSVENIDGFHEDYFVQQFDLLPKNILSKFVRDGWTIRIDSNYLAEYSWQNNGKRYGPLFYAVSDYPSKTIITHSYNPAIHEIGRYCYNEFADKETVNQLFAAEAEKLRADSIGEELTKAKGFSLETAEGFFANCFVEYTMARDNEKMQEYLIHLIPLTYDYLSTEVFSETMPEKPNQSIKIKGGCKNTSIS